MLEKGTFNLTSSVTMNDNTSLYGSGMDITILRFTTDMTAIVNQYIGGSQYNSNIALQEFTVDGNYTGVTGSSNAIEVQHVNGFSMYHVKIENPRAFCCSIRFSTNVTVNACQAYASGQYHDGFKLAGTTNALFENCNIASGDDCVSSTGEQLAAGNVTITHNTLTSDFAHGVFIGPEADDPMPVSNDTISYNTIYSTADAGISLYAVNEDVLLSNITIVGNNITSPGMQTLNPSGAAYGIHCSGNPNTPAQNITVTGNNITFTNTPSSQSARGILFELTNGITVSNNVVSFNEALASDSRGIQIGDAGVPCSNFDLESNQVNNNGHGADAIAILRSSTGQLDYNTAKNGNQAGIFIEGDSTNSCQNITLYANTCIDDQSVHTQQYGVLEGSNSDYNIITNNDVCGYVVSAVSTTGKHTTVSGTIICGAAPTPTPTA